MATAEAGTLPAAGRASGLVVTTVLLLDCALGGGRGESLRTGLLPATGRQRTTRFITTLHPTLRA